MIERHTYTNKKLFDKLPFGVIRLYFDEQAEFDTLQPDVQIGGSYLIADTHSPLEKDEMVNAMIRVVYSQSNVEAIMRHKLAEEDNGKFDEFNNFAEQIKLRADEILANQ